MKFSSSANEAKGFPLKKASVSEVFKKANRKATYGKDCARKNHGLKSKPPVRWCFQGGDNKVKRWIPQGVTSDSDAVSDGSWNGQNGLMVSWYSTGKQGVRITLLNTKTKKYRHLLLVVPFRSAANGQLNYSPLRLHAGGIVWYGERLYVADTYNGVRVFDLKNIYDLTASPNGNVTIGKIGRYGNRYYAGRYRYVIPQSGRWKSPRKASASCKPSGPIHNSWMSLDRSSRPDRLVVGEFCAKRGDTTPGRVTLWKMSNHEIASSGGTATAAQVLSLPAVNGARHGANVQGGATTDGSTWFFSISHGAKAAGTLARFQNRAPTRWHGRGTKKTPQGPEDLTFRYRHSKRLLYSVSEYAGYRIIYARNTYSGWG